MTTVLALDTASPTVGVAVARDGRLLAAAELPQRRSAPLMLGAIDRALAEAGVARDRLAGVVAQAGPGSFTGLRVGLALALGMHQGGDLPAVAVPTLEALAAADPRRLPRVAALAHAVADQWYWQRFGSGAEPLGPPERGGTADLPTDVDGWVVVGPAPPREGPPCHEIGNLAVPVAIRASLAPPAWDASTLTRPLYLAPPPASLPGPAKRVSGE